jgi:cell division protein FtsA
MSKEVYAGLDIGTSKITVAAGVIDDDNIWHILGLEKIASTGVRRGEIVDEERVKSDLEKLLKRFKEKTGIFIKNVNVAIGGQYIRNVKNRENKLFDKIKEVEAEDVKELKGKSRSVLMEQGEKVVAVYPMEFAIDRGTPLADPVGMTGKRIDGIYNVVVGRNFTTRKIEQCASACGLKIKNVVLSPIASANVALTIDDKRRGVALVDIGCGSTSLVVYHNGMLKHAAVIPFGGEVISYDIKTRFGITLKQAEITKLCKGVAYNRYSEDVYFTPPTSNGEEPIKLNVKELSNTIQCRLEEIIDGINYQLKLSNVQDKLDGGIVLCGGTSNIPFIKELMELKTGKRVRLGVPNENIIETDNINKNLAYVAVLGLMAHKAEVKSHKGIKSILGSFFK